MRSGKPSVQTATGAKEDLHRIQIGTRLEQNDRKHVVTGRVRYVFKNTGYLNLWHCESAGVSSGWIAESYHSYAWLVENPPQPELQFILKMRLNEFFAYKEIRYLIRSSELVSGVQMEGEIKEFPIRKKHLVITAFGTGKAELHIHTSGANDMTVLEGINLDFKQSKFENLRF